MLISLTVRHLAIVDDIVLNFNNGMTSLTGETGAGKSILVDALGLVLGDRADSNMIRRDHQRAEIEATFDISYNPDLQQWLQQQELDDQNFCQLRRTISRDGRSRGYINGRAVPVNQLRIVSEHSVDIHGQHAHQSLLRSDTQRQLLDTVADTKPLLDNLASAYKNYQKLQKEVTEQTTQAEQRAAQLDLLSYQVQELEPLELSDENVQLLLTEQAQLANASQLATVAQSTLYQVFEDEGNAAYDVISHSLTELQNVADIEPRFENVIEMLTSVTAQLDESASDLRHYVEHIDINPSRLDEVETKLATLHSLARKHHVEIEDLPAHFELLSDKLHNLQNSDKKSAELQQELKKQEAYCRQLCKKISQQRQSISGPLAQQISNTINKLAIPAGKIEFVITPMANENFNETGADQIQLLVSTNPGQPAGVLEKVASGGELARISLAIQVVTAGKRSVPTLVFDEVDVGIGGGVAEIVGQHLRQLAATQQVICITHLPQVAAQAYHQLQVSKKQSTDSTYIEISQLDSQQRVEEIARMLGGVKLTEKTLSHAEEMLQQAIKS